VAKDGREAYRHGRYLKKRVEILAQNEAWRLAHPDRAREIRRKSMVKIRRAKPELVHAADRRWRQKHPEKVRDKVARRRALKKGNGPAESIDYRVVYERDMGICGICYEPVSSRNWHLDHVIPLSKGGTHTYGNVQVSHPECNLSKGAGQSP